jgi:hypothetical protein
MIKKIIKKIIPQRIINSLKLFLTKFKEIVTPNWLILTKWKKTGKPVPPPHYIKQLIIKKYQKMFNVDIFVETGTYMGDMVCAMKNKFKKIYSIELSHDLRERAVRKFKNQKHITILWGDSGKVLCDIIPEIKERAIFWLDGHYSAGITAKGEKNCPIFEELTAIFSSSINHILLIDDARCFDGSDDYPTIKALSEFILLHRDKSEIEIDDDVIRVIIK